MVPKHWLTEGFPHNVRVLITVCNQEEADRDVPKLLELPCKNGISYEPALGPVNWEQYLLSPLSLDGWIIVGGESAQGGAPARPFDLAWGRNTIQQARQCDLAVFVKQLGSKPFYEFANGCDAFPSYADRAGADPTEWPEDLRVQQFPT